MWTYRGSVQLPGTAGEPTLVPQPFGAPTPVDEKQVASVLKELIRTVQQLTSLLQARQGASSVTKPDVAAPTNGAGAGAGAVQKQQPGGAAEFRLASFNALGASHTNASGNKPEYASGAARTPGMIRYLDKHDVDVVGLQEFQDSQVKKFKASNTGFELESRRDNAIAWKSDKFRKVSSTTVKIPYFEGQTREMPVVQLEDKATGKRAWFINIHNPADTKAHRNQGAYRTEALKRENALIDKLQKTGLPVFIVGDFNARADAHSAITGDGDMKASKPKQVKTGIDWVFGSSSVDFSKGATDRGTINDRLSDHPMVVTTTKI
jgi:exonuclease III